MSDTVIINSGYKRLLQEIKQKVRSSQIKAALSVNKELIQLYWEIGNALCQKEEAWGAKTIETLVKDLKLSFPDMKGFSFRNLKYMVQLVNEYPERSIGQQLIAQIP